MSGRNNAENARVTIIIIAAVIFFGLATQTSYLTSTIPALPCVNTNNNSNTQFDEALRAAYHTATNVKPRRSKVEFDVETWEQRTEGGLSDRDRTLLAKVYGEADSLFEFGLGESTYIANHMGVPRYAGVDSDPEWVKMARTNVKNPSYRFSFADIGDTVLWGYPNDTKLPKNEMNYQLGPLSMELLPFDVYMVDGRWRLPCLLLSFLHASSRGADHSDTIVLLHDCWQKNGTTHHFDPGRNRTDYRRADHLLDLIDHSGNYLCVYKRKPTTTNDELLDLWKKHHSLVG